MWLLAHGVAFLLTVHTGFWFNRFLAWNENRPDLANLTDRFQEQLPLLDTSNVVSGLQHVCHILFAWEFFAQRVSLLRLEFALNVLFTMRLITIYLCPLRGHPKMYVLKDAYLDWVARRFPRLGLREGMHYRNDLFFSGHTSVCMIITLLLPTDSWTQLWGLGCTVVVAVGLVLSRVHYTVDVVVAPVMAFWAVHASQLLEQRFLRLF